MIAYVHELLSLFDRRTRLQLGGLAVLMIGAAVLEMAGLGLFLPLLQVLANPEAVAKNRYLSQIVELLGEGSNERFVLVFSGVLFAFFIFKNAVLFSLVMFQNRFVLRKQANFQTRVLRNYLFRPYTFYLGRNTAELVRNVTQSAAMVFTRALLPLLNVMMESFLGLAVIAILVIVEPWSTLAVMAVFSGVVASYYFATHNLFRGWSQIRESSAAAMIKVINQGAGTIKETKVMGREDYFLREFEREAHSQARSQAMTATFTQAPRFVTEIAAVGVLAVVFLIVLAQGRPFVDAVPLLGLFALATIRLVPSVNRITTNIATARSAIAAVENISADLRGQAAATEDEAARAVAPMPFTREIKLAGLGYTYENAEGPALRDIDLTVRVGEAVALVGASGAGKTTLADIILGILVPQKGAITIDGRDLRDNVEGWQRRIGYVPQEIYLTDDSIRRNIALGLDDHEIDDARVRAAIAAARLEQVVDALPDGPDTVIGERGLRISGGQRQRVGIARALYHDPDVLVLDEATAALDSETERDIALAIESLHGVKTVIIIAHRLSTVRNCDRLCFMRDGGIAATGTFDELYKNESGFRRLVELAELNPVAA